MPFPQLQEFLAQQVEAKKTVYPAAENVFAWSHACSFQDVKVVILGQVWAQRVRLA
jgi:uracil DNA glycosylase